MIRIAVLAGGTSGERAVSLRSATAVTQALHAAGYDKVSQIDTAAISEAKLEESLEHTDVVFPALHGLGGEDGTIQAWLEKRNIAFVGADSRSSALCFDKWRYKQKMVDLGIATPKGELVSATTFHGSLLTAQPFVLKPFDGGSSVDTHIIRDPTHYDHDAVDQTLQKYPQMLLEELIEGIEITVGVLDDQALPVIEIIPPSDAEFDYENKYNGKTQELCPPEHVTEAVQQEAQAIAAKIHKELGLRDMSRTDIMIRSSDNQLFVLETNTIPGLTDQSLLPKAAATAGLPMPRLIDRLVRAAWARSGRA